MDPSDGSEDTGPKTRKPELPGLLGEVFHEIENEVIALHAEWGVYQQIFEKDEDWRLLSASSNFGWPILHDALVERCVLRITRLTDRSKRTLSFDYLIRLLKEDRHNELCKELRTDLKAVIVLIEPPKDLRDNVLAHTSDTTATGKRGYPVVSIESINKLLPRIANLCQKFRMAMGIVHCSYDMCIGAWAGEITESLRKLQRFTTLRDRIRDREPLDIYELKQAILKAGRG